MNPFLSAGLVLAALTQSSDIVSSGARYEVATSRNAPAVPQTQVVQSRSTGTSVPLLGDIYAEPSLGDRTRKTVLVVPSPDLSAERLVELAEDLTVMCRIFEKSLPSTRGSVSFAYADHRYGIVQETRGVQGLYLDGYGALFFFQVNYPLVPPPQQEQTPAKAAEPVDSVWSQTIEEMSGRQPAKGPADRSEPPYDAARVENLRKTFIKTLVHAANLRMRRTQDLITLVAGNLDEERTVAYGVRSRSTTGRRSVGATTSLSGSRSEPARSTGSARSALMILRVAKSDVDAFAKGQLTLAQFTEKVQILWSPTIRGEPEASPSAPTTVDSRR